MVHIFTDGACSGNPGCAGIGVFIEGKFNYEISKYIGVKTNNYAELCAIKIGITLIYSRIKRLPIIEPITVKVFSDSKYSLGVLENYNWNIQKNREIILTVRKRIRKLRHLKSVKSVFFIHVKGHSGVRGNVKADRLAVMGKNKLKKSFIRKIKR